MRPVRQSYLLEPECSHIPKWEADRLEYKLNIFMTYYPIPLTNLQENIQQLGGSIKGLPLALPMRQLCHRY